MAEENLENMTFEPEEGIEAAIIALLSSEIMLPIKGALTPGYDGGKVLYEDSYISVIADQYSQDLDTRGRRVPLSYSLSVKVRCSIADDESGAEFCNTCRAVRSILTSLTGDGCTTLNADGFDCDAFIIDSTSTTYETGENAARVKAYSATLKGRITTTTEAS